MATVQKVGAVLKKTRLPKGGWSASGRVSGWGRFIEGWSIESEKNQWYVCRVCHQRSDKGHRSGDNLRRCLQMGQRAWQKRSESTGKVIVNWSEGEHTPRFNQQEALTQMTTSLQDAGLTVTQWQGTLVVEGG